MELIEYDGVFFSEGIFEIPSVFDSLQFLLNGVQQTLTWWKCRKAALVEKHTIALYEKDVNLYDTDI